MTAWKRIRDTGYPDQETQDSPFYAQVGPENSTAGTWSWTLLRANLDGTQSELTSGTAASEELAKMLAETARLGALAQYETAEG